MGRVEGKVAVVTGGASGIGRAAAQALAAERARVGIADVDEAGGERVAAGIRDAGGDAFFRRTDVRSLAEVEAVLAEAVDRHGRLDVLVNNAAISVAGSAGEMAEEDWARVIDVNLSGVWRGLRAAIPRMLAQGGGSIVNLSSVQAHVGFLGWSGYAASKGGIDALTRQAAVEYARAGIRVNAIVPGTIMTEMNEAIMRESADGDAVMAGWVAMHPMGRIGQPEEVAAAIVFLASDEASFITGELLRVDGGLVVKAG
ncbi:MAG TPA: SDR family NAD(P)-dependent oxidoreductase [Actinomycetes bacterium]|jgi:NAD(P)-dependent dehydrogenase (short-subunit alcohol dehydrogenase family)|nr:SDR family NAD(P)-dependent oxidoreductase [Actinomycetes bacterium]